MEAQEKENGKKAGKKSKRGLSVGALNQPEGCVGQIHLKIGVEELSLFEDEGKTRGFNDSFLPFFFPVLFDC